MLGSGFQTNYAGSRKKKIGSNHLTGSGFLTLRKSFDILVIQFIYGLLDFEGSMSIFNCLNIYNIQVEQLSGGPLLHAIRRVSDLPSLPPGVLKTLEWQLRKDIAEVERVARSQSEQQIWLSNNRYQFV